MEGSPFSNMLDIMKEEGYNKDVSVRVGEISSISPLKVKLNGYDIEEEDMFISETLHNILNDDNETLVTTKAFDVLKPEKKAKIGDRVLLLLDDETFYLIDRVV